jgi:hypothetical protein
MLADDQVLAQFGGLQFGWRLLTAVAGCGKMGASLVQ